jgi:heat shock protein HtpX
MNQIRTAIMLAGLTALFITIGYSYGGLYGAMVALVFAILMNLYTYWNADKVIMRIYNAKPVNETSPIYNIIDRLAFTAGIPMPRLFMVESKLPNAFATGRNPAHAAIAITTGLLTHLTEKEATAVIAHEMAHIKNRDTLIMTITATIAGAISMIANFLFFFGSNERNVFSPLAAMLTAFIAPIAAMLVQFSIARSREYHADKIGAELCGDPLSLISALRKISWLNKQSIDEKAERYPGTAHIFIINPLHAHTMDNLFSTHPSLENRIRMLLEMVYGEEVPEEEVYNDAPYAPGPWG